MKIVHLGSKDQNLNFNDAGGKAFNLHLLKLQEYDVPPGFIVTKVNDLNKIILDDEIKKIGGFPIAIRSSGNMEDLKNASFAGLYKTFLEVNSIEEAAESIKKCFESIHSEQVKSYLDIKKENLNLDDLNDSMRVLVQKMITPQISGVAFGIDPISGKEEISLIECVAGLGERLVSGNISPTRYYFNNQQDFTTSETIGEDKISLTNNQLTEISQITQQIQSFFEHPQDIEWCLDLNNKLWILQSRPITYIKWRNDVDELTNADLKDGGISARSCTPLMFSLYETVMNDSMTNYFHKLTLLDKKLNPPWIHYYYARGYWNASLVKKCLLKIPGFAEEKFDKDLGIQKDYGEKGPVKVPFNLKTIMGALPIIYFLNKEFKDSIRMFEIFKHDFEKLDHDYKGKINIIPSLSDEKLYTLYNQMFENYYLITEKNYFRIIYNNSNYQTEFKSYLEGIEKKSKIKIEILPLLSHLSNISHLEIQRDLNDLTKNILAKGENHQETLTSYNYFMSKHYHHGDAELDITKPRWGETPNKVWEMAKENLVINNFDSNQFNLDEIIPGEYQTKKFKTMLTKCRHFLTVREKMREFSTRSYYIVRLYTLELAKRLYKNKILKNESDIFYYKISELLLLINESKNLSSSVIQKRKITYNSYKRFTPPNDFGGKVKQNVSQSRDNNKQFHGVASAPGIYQGRVKIITELDDSFKLNKGDILVTKFTDPGWTPLLSKAGAVVTEVGGILSHAAVISREYGIPAILNIQNITKILKDNELVEINGDDGIVTILD